MSCHGSHIRMVNYGDPVIMMFSWLCPYLRKAGRGGGGWHVAMVGFFVCRWRRQLADCHFASLPFPFLEWEGKRGGGGHVPE